MTDGGGAEAGGTDPAAAFIQAQAGRREEAKIEGFSQDGQESSKNGAFSKNGVAVADLIKQ